MDYSPPGFCACDFLGKNAKVNCNFFLQGTFQTQGLNPHLIHWQEDSLPLSQQGSPLPLNRGKFYVHFVLFLCYYFKKLNLFCIFILILNNTKIRYVFTNQLKPIILVSVFSLHLNILQIAHYCHYDYIRVNDSLISPH